MKIFSVIALLLCLQAIAQDKTTRGPEMSFQKLVHDFGTVYQGDKTEFAFVFTNTGDEPLIIQEVRSSCGCTVPAWTKEPIMPGKSGQILVQYNSNIIGKFNKQITVLSNAKNGMISLRIMGNVEQLPSEIMPVQQNANLPVNK